MYALPPMENMSLHLCPLPSWYIAPFSCPSPHLNIVSLSPPADVMGGYTAPPVMLSGGTGGKPDRGSKNRAYSQYGAGSYGYGPGGWGEHPMGPGFFGPAAFGIHMPMMRGHMGMDPAGMDYMADQFQG